MAWTEERVSLLKKLWTEGFTASQIAGQFGDVTRNAVIGKVHRLGLSGRAVTSRFRGPRVRVRQQSRQAPIAQEKPSLYPTAGNAALKADAVLLEDVRPQSAPRPMPRLVPKPAPLSEPASAEGVDLLSLGHHSCRWPIGDPTGEDFHFCGCRKAEGSPYCEHHSAIAYQPAGRRRARQAA